MGLAAVESYRLLTAWPDYVRRPVSKRKPGTVPSDDQNQNSCPSGGLFWIPLVTGRTPIQC